MTRRHATTAPKVRFAATVDEEPEIEVGRSRYYASVLLTGLPGQPFHGVRPLRGRCPIMSHVDRSDTEADVD